MWRSEGVCADFIGSELYAIHGDVFHESNGDPEKVAVALAMCAVCPVRWDCLRQGLNPPNTDRNEKWSWGIWGGETEESLMALVNEDENGKPLSKLTPHRMTCPYCLTNGTVETTKIKRTRKHLECTRCGLAWWSKTKLNIIPIEDDNEEG